MRTSRNLIAGASRFITMDLYRKEIQGFFQVPVDNLRASPFLLSYIKEHVSTRALNLAYSCATTD